MAAYFDQAANGILFVATKTGEILLYDAYSSSNLLKNDLMECKLIGSIFTKLQSRMKASNKRINFNMRVIKSSIVLYSEDGIFEYISTSDVKDLLTNPQPYEYQSSSTAEASSPFIA